MTLKELQEQKMKEFDEQFFYRGEGSWGHYTSSRDDDDNLISDKVPAYAVPESLQRFIQQTQLETWNSAVEACAKHAEQGIEYYTLCENRPVEVKTLRNFIDNLNQLKGI